MKTLSIIWDFDGPIGMVNSTYPYNFSPRPFKTEQTNVLQILDVLDEFSIKATFAVTGLGCEKGIMPPFKVSHLVKQIHQNGHEIASHSWKHENFSKLNFEQAKRSLLRSKKILEEITGGGTVFGFIPPHNRPMTWLKKGRISVGDNRIFPFQKTGDLSGILDLLNDCGYRWIRISGHSVFHKLMKISPKQRAYFAKNQLVLDHHYCGFDKIGVEIQLESKAKHITLSAHPLMWSRANKKESMKNFRDTVLYLKQLEQSGDLVILQPRQLLDIKSKSLA